MSSSSSLYLPQSPSILVNHISPSPSISIDEIVSMSLFSIFSVNYSVSQTKAQFVVTSNNMLKGNLKVSIILHVIVLIKLVMMQHSQH